MLNVPGLGLPCFSPLLDGDGVASTRRSWVTTFKSSFSPLLDGDGVASGPASSSVREQQRFSPLLDGDGVASRTGSRSRERVLPVSVPFSMGTVLHLLYRDGFAFGPLSFQSPSRWGRCCIVQVNLSAAQYYWFQSPSRWGRCCIGGGSHTVRYSVVVSVPFSMGTVLHRGEDHRPHHR